MSFAPSVLPSTAFALLDEARFDHDFGHMVDESELGYWSSDLECGSEYVRPSYLSSDDLEDVAGVYGEGESLQSYFDCLSTFDADDYEYQQSLV